jgi:hypothetical protein
MPVSNFVRLFLTRQRPLSNKTIMCQSPQSERIPTEYYEDPLNIPGLHLIVGADFYAVTPNWRFFYDQYPGSWILEASEYGPPDEPDVCVVRGVYRA